MTPTPLFTQAELTAAFALLLSPEQAAALAAQRFEEFADEIDHEGRFVSHDRWHDGVPAADAPVRPVDLEAWNAPQVVAGDEATFRTFSDDTAAEWLLRSSDLHLGLVALVSPAAFDRMRDVRGMTTRQAERNRLQLQRAIGAYRSRRGWPAAT